MSSDELRVRLRGVTKVYASGQVGIRWRSAIPVLPEAPATPNHALDGLDLELRAGESVGIIGPNGAGKSTALKVVAGLTTPTSGTVEVRGSIRSMIELGVGFHPELTGWENVQAGLIMYGYGAEQIRAALEGIADFAGIPDAMDTPLKHYSMGMRARLAFAVATDSRPDVLVVDEVLAVGDHDFQLRCIERIATMVGEGTGLLFVSHQMPLVAMVCERVVHLRQGRVVDDGPAAEVVERYLTRSPSRYKPDPALGAHIERCAEVPDIDPWGAWEIDLDVEVERALAEPRIGVDVYAPTVTPDIVSCSSIQRLPGIAKPGRYRVRGRSRAIPAQNGLCRLSVSLTDGIAVADVVHADTRIRGDNKGSSSEPAVAIDFALRQVADRAEPEVVRRVEARSVEAPVVVLEGATKRFHAGTRRGMVRDALPGRLGVRRDAQVVALADVSLAVGRGEALGLIGANGAGKSTLLRAVAGLLRVDAGRVWTTGRVVPLLDPGAGLHPVLTGRENMVRLGGFLGMAPDAVAAVADEVIELAGLGDAIDAPLREYSSGMRARLAMAIGLGAPADVLLIDELLAVGDEEFRNQTLERVALRVRDGLTVLFVSHEMRLIEQLCDRVVHLEHGAVVDDGPASVVVDAYGGSEWGSGIQEASSGVRLRPMRLRQRHIAVGGRFQLEGELVVEVPSPTTRLELVYRSTHGGRPELVTDEYREAATFLRRTLEPTGGALARPGRYAYELDVDRNGFAGSFDLVLSVVDERDQVVSAETWQEVKVGDDRPEGFPGPVIDFDWEVSPVGS